VVRPNNILLRGTQDTDMIILLSGSVETRNSWQRGPLRIGGLGNRQGKIIIYNKSFINWTLWERPPPKNPVPRLQEVSLFQQRCMARQRKLNSKMITLEKALKTGLNFTSL
jgi:hypothetical protein